MASAHSPTPARPPLPPPLAGDGGQRQDARCAQPGGRLALHPGDLFGPPDCDGRGSRCPSSPADTLGDPHADLGMGAMRVFVQDPDLVLVPNDVTNDDVRAAAVPSPTLDYPLQTFANLVHRQATTVIDTQSLAPSTTTVTSPVYYSYETTTLPGGTTVVILTTVPTQASSTTSPQPTQVHGSAQSDLGPLLGGLLGGFFGLLVLVTAGWCAWRRRYALRREPSIQPDQPTLELRYADRASRFSSQFSGYKSPQRSSVLDATPSPTPYEYGMIGRPKSVLSMSSSGAPPTPSRLPSPSASQHGHSMSPSTPSAYAYTPGGGTPVASPPGIAASSSRTPTPTAGYPSPLQHYQQEWAQRRELGAEPRDRQVSWPQYGGEDGEERRSPVLRPRSERRPSRLSLTLANWNPATDEDFVVREEDEEGSKRVETSEEEKTDSGVAVSKEVPSSPDASAAASQT